MSDAGGAGDITLDRLADPAQGLEVVTVRDAVFGAAAGGPREPHRHDYHELIWACSGEGRHTIDGVSTPVAPRTVTLIGRGQVHVFEEARALTGAVVRFREEMLFDGHVARANPGWLLHGRCARIVEVPESEAAHLDALIATLAAELARPLDPVGLDVRRHLVSCLLLWVERWHDASQSERPDPMDGDTGLFRRFMQALERDFAREHGAAHYAEALAVPQSQLSRALARAVGHTTKELITDRVMLEATRLVRFTDLSFGEIAYRVGFRDQMYFSRAFRRHAGRTPSEDRAMMRGTSAG